ncbi:PAS domain S-box protein, partial [bacterium]
FASQACARFGYTPEQMVGRNIEDFVLDDDKPELLKHRAAILAGQDPDPLEVRILDAQGKPRTVRTTIRPLKIGSRVLGLTGVLVDLTKQRETEEQLRVAQRMEALGRLAGGVAHDFNNLLSVILSYTELALGELRTDDPLHADLSEVSAAARRAEGLTRQLLAFGRTQQKRLEPFELADLVNGTTNLLRRLIGEDVEFVFVDQTIGRDARVLGDRGQIEQVLMNLVVNARDAMPDGGRVTTSTRCEYVDAEKASGIDLLPGEYSVMSVRDTGCGMDAATRARIFEPFFTTKEPGRGTGLGLALVFGIVRQYGGAIAVASRPGEGSSFDVYLPRFDAERAREGDEVEAR